jgi:hypothetical protein
MKRVETLLQKLQEQFKEGATTRQLLLTTQMLQHELMHLQQQGPKAVKEVVSVSMPANMNFPPQVPAKADEVSTVKAIISPVKEEEKIIEVLKVDEAELEAELEEIKRNAALMQQMSGKSKPQLLFDVHDDDIPTLPKQKSTKKEINETVAAEESPSVNDILKTPIKELSHKLTDVGIKDLKKAIGINDRYLFISDLFRGDEAMYERSIKTINSFSILPEAEYWIRRELKTKLGWTDANLTVVHFDQLVKRRFS